MKENTRRLIVAFFVGVFTLFAFLSIPAIAAEDFYYSDYNLGSGIPGYVEETLIQSAIKQKALAKIVEWRQDALDTGVKWPNKDSNTTMKQWLENHNISESDYLNPKWSNILEHISIERAVEVDSTNVLAHRRPNGEYVFNLSYKGKYYNSEVIAWGFGSIELAIDAWASEKEDWIDLNSNGITGHYEYLINPEAKCYGMAGFIGFNQPYGSTWVGISKYSALSDESPTELSGPKMFKVNLSDEMLADGLKIDVDELSTGEVVQPVITNKAYRESDSFGAFWFPEDRFSFRGTWTSADTSIVGIENNKLKGVGNGNTVVKLTTEDGSIFEFNMEVKNGIVSVENPDNVTTESGTIPILPSTVVANYSDGTTANLPVVWDSFPESSWRQIDGGEFTVEGSVEGYSSKVTVKVIVNPATVTEVVIDGTESTIFNVTTKSGNPPVLPEKAKITWSNGDVTKEDINWPNSTEYNSEEAITYTLTKFVKEVELKVNVNVTVSPVEFEMKRLSGKTRYDTAVEVSKEMGDESEYVIIVNGRKYPDALSSTPLAKLYSAPILLVKRNGIPDSTKEEIERLGASKAIIVGGKGVVSNEVASELEGMGLTVERYSGKDRYKTALAVAEKVVGMSEDTNLILVKGTDFPDALTVTSLALKEEIPILLTNPNVLSEEVKSFIEEQSPSKLYIAGGKGAVSLEIESDIEDLGISVTRFSGKDRYETGKEIAEYVYPSPKEIIFANGRDFADAMVGGPLTTVNGGPVMLVGKNHVPQATKNYITPTVAEGVNKAYIVGGKGVVSEGVKTELTGILD